MEKQETQNCFWALSPEFRRFSPYRSYPDSQRLKRNSLGFRSESCSSEKRKIRFGDIVSENDVLGLPQNQLYPWYSILYSMNFARCFT